MMTNEEIPAGLPKEIAGVPITTIATGLFTRELALQRLKSGVDKLPENDFLKLSASERRKDIGTRVKIMRRILGISQDALADKLGISKAAVAAYEIGRSEPSLTSLVGLSRSLGVTTDWLLGEPPPPSK